MTKNVDLKSVALAAIEVFVRADIFITEDEIETLTGFYIQDYKALLRTLGSVSSLKDIGDTEVRMIYRAANTLLAIPHDEKLLYTKYLGESYKESLELLMSCIKRDHFRK